MTERINETDQSLRTTFTRNGFRRGFIAAQPLAIGVLVYGLTFGLLAVSSGFSVLDALLMSATVYSGSAQTASVGAIAAGAGLLTTVSTVVLLNARYVLYGATLRPWLGRTSPVNAYGSLYLLADGNWLLSMKARDAGEHDAGYILGSGLEMFLPWLAGTAAGGLIGGWIPAPKALALDFLLVAFCAAMMIGMVRSKASLWPAAAALVLRWWPIGSHQQAGQLFQPGSLVQSRHTRNTRTCWSQPSERRGQLLLLAAGADAGSLCLPRQRLLDHALRRSDAKARSSVACRAAGCHGGDSRPCCNSRRSSRAWRPSNCRRCDAVASQ